MHNQKLGTLAFVIDERLPREKKALLTRVVNALRQIVTVELFSGNCNEDELIAKLEGKTYQLVLLPWYRYLSWSKIEAAYGLTRTSGPTVAGYFCDQLLPYEIESAADHLRAILLDFVNLEVGEILRTVRALIVDQHRSGLRPLLDPTTLIHCENWYGSQGIGTRLDAILNLPEISAHGWMPRANSIRLCLCALWSLIYEEGPGKVEVSQALTGTTPRAYFQVGISKQMLAFRLFYTMPSWTPKDILRTFWPTQSSPSHPAQLLLSYADFMRVHPISSTQDLEVTVGLTASAPADKAHKEVHTLWIEPLAPQLVIETPYQAPGPQFPLLRALPSASLADPRPRGVAGPIAVDGAETDRPEIKDKALFTAAVKLKELKTQLEERDGLIRELKSGGVGTAKELPPPDAEALLEAFQQRYFDAKFQLRQLELEVTALEKSGGSPQQIEELRLKMAALANREQAWIKRIAETIEAFGGSAKGKGGGQGGGGSASGGR